jgi:UDP-hydrolysing UDP-N-acetyl-D-glucosamine 2-epimerase
MSKLNLKKKICVITGSRADYGILSRLLVKLNKNFDLKVIATGSHLSNKFGYTLNDIKSDNVKIYKKIKVIDNDDSGQGILNSLTNSINKFSKVFKKNKIDLLIVLGDRYEVFGACIAASVMRIKIAHIHGGETTSNSIDEMFRHSISLMSHFHFVAAKKYKEKVSQLAKNIKNIFLVGSLSVANIKKLKLKKNETLLKYKLNPLKKRIFLQHHSETLDNNQGKNGFLNCLAVLKKYKNYEIVATLSNADEGHDFFNKKLKEYKKLNKNFYLLKSIKYEDYLAILKSCDFIIGNSSSGIIEAPSLSVPTVNIGLRQDGRLRARSIYDASDTIVSIENNIKLALKFNKKRKIKNFYDHGDSVHKILKVLRSLHDGKNLKNFYFKSKKL